MFISLLNTYRNAIVVSFDKFLQGKRSFFFLTSEKIIFFIICSASLVRFGAVKRTLKCEIFLLTLYINKTIQIQQNTDYPNQSVSVLTRIGKNLDVNPLRTVDIRIVKVYLICANVA